MAWARVAVVDENFNPQAQCTVEAFNLDTFAHGPVATAVSDNGGMALFLTLPSNARYFFKPRTTRAAGSYGQATQMGKQVQILQHSAMQCVDAYIEPSGQWGTDKTVQAAVTRVGALTGTFNVFVAEGTYTENVVVSSTTAAFIITGCAPVLNFWPGALQTFTLSAGNNLAVIDGGAGIALQKTGTQPLVLVGLQLINNAAATATMAPDGGRVRMRECAVSNSGAGDAIGSATGPVQLWLDNCIVASAAFAVNCTSTNNTLCRITNSWLSGKVNAYGSTSFEAYDSSFSASNTTFVIQPGVLRGTVARCYVYQASTGDGINIPNSTDGVWFVLDNTVQSAATGTNGVKVGTGATSFGTASNNILKNWTNGFNIAFAITLRGNQYGGVTNPVNSVLGTEFVGGRAYRNGAFAIPNAAITQVTIDTVSFDPYGLFNITTTFNFTTPQDGFYGVSGSLFWPVAAAAGTVRYTLLYVNGVLVRYGTTEGTVLTTSAAFDDIIALKKGDILDLRGFQDSGAPLNLVVTGGASCWLSVHLLQQ